MTNYEIKNNLMNKKDEIGYRIINTLYNPFELIEILNNNTTYQYGVVDNPILKKFSNKNKFLIIIYWDEEKNQLLSKSLIGTK